MANKEDKPSGDPDDLSFLRTVRHSGFKKMDS